MTEMSNKMDEHAPYNPEAKVLFPSMIRGGNSTMVRVVLCGTAEPDSYGMRPRYGAQLFDVTEGGPVLLHEEWIYGPAMGVWPEAEEMAISFLGWCTEDPEEIGDDYGADWSAAMREWNFDYGETLNMVRYDYSASQCGNAVDGEFVDGQFVVRNNFELTDAQAIAFLTGTHRLTWLTTDPREWLDDDDRAAIAALRTFWGVPAAA